MVTLQNFILALGYANTIGLAEDYLSARRAYSIADQ